MTNLPPIVQKKYNSMDAEVVDIDGDGDLDIVIAVEFVKNVILLNDGSGKFTDGSDLLPSKKATKVPKPYQYYPYHDSEDVAVADFDKDGSIEIIIVTEDDKQNEYYEMNASGTFTDISDRLPGTGVTNGVIAHDFDNDGWIDIITSQGSGDPIRSYYYKNEGNAGSPIFTKTPLDFVDAHKKIVTGDINGDGFEDLVVANEFKLSSVMRQILVMLMEMETSTYILPMFSYFKRLELRQNY